MALSDVELGYALCPDAPHLGAWRANRLPAEKRAIYERMTEFGDAWNLWAAGVGEKPDMTGVIVTPETRRRTRP